MSGKLRSLITYAADLSPTLHKCSHLESCILTPIVLNNKSVQLPYGFPYAVGNQCGLHVLCT